MSLGGPGSCLGGHVEVTEVLEGETVARRPGVGGQGPAGRPRGARPEKVPLLSHRRGPSLRRLNKKPGTGGGADLSSR